MDHSMTARLAQAETTSNQPVSGRYQRAAEAITYSQRTCSSSHMSGCQSALPMDQRVRSDTMKATSTEAKSTARKQTNGMTMSPTSTFDRTVAVSDIGSD